jgi:hypothetical protein
MSSNTQKLRIIRSKTDHDLLILLQHELDRGLAVANVAVTRNSPQFDQSQKAYETVVSLLSKIPAMEENDRLRLATRVNELRSRLDQVPTHANLRPFTVSVAS